MDCCCSVAQLCLTIFNPMDCCMPGFPVLYYPLEFAQTHVHWAYPTISSPVPLLLLLPSIFLSIRVFSEESALHIRWPKYWSFSFSISPSSEYSGLISFGIEMDMPTFSAYNPLPKLVTPVPLSSRNCPILPCPRESQISGVKKKKSHPAWNLFLLSYSDTSQKITTHSQMWVRSQGNHPTKLQVLRTVNPENSPHLSLSSPTAPISVQDCYSPPRHWF